MTDQQALALVAKAQDGDAEAQRAVALHCFAKYVARVTRLWHKLQDPAVSLDDAQMTFFEGCMRAVLIIDDRGDPLYHVGQRGIWALQSEIRVMRREMSERARYHVRQGEDGQLENPVDLVQDERASEAYGRVEDQMLALERVHLITTAPLKPRARQAVDIIMKGAAGDPMESGFNKRLADEMGVSPQRASQIVQEIRSQVE
jgi:hypothetical protein